MPSPLALSAVPFLRILPPLFPVCSVTGMRLRINPYAFTWGPSTSSRGRWANWTASQNGNVIDLHGVNHRKHKGWHH